MIREAREDDLRRLMEMSERYYPKTYYANVVPFDADSIAVLHMALMENGILLVAEIGDEVVGMCGFILSPFIFEPMVTGAYGVYWWVEPEYEGMGIGKEFLSAIDPLAKARGASYIHVGCMADSPIKAASLLIKSGYDHTEMSFTKRI